MDYQRVSVVGILIAAGSLALTAGSLALTAGIYFLERDDREFARVAMVWDFIHQFEMAASAFEAGKSDTIRFSDSSMVISHSLEYLNKKGESLERRSLDYIQVPDIKLIGANLTGTRLCSAILTDSVLREADLQNAGLEGTELVRADLQNASFKKAFLRKANLKNADLSGVNFNGANLTGAYLSGATLSVSTSFENTMISGANFEKLELAEGVTSEALKTMLEEACISEDGKQPEGLPSGIDISKMCKDNLPSYKDRCDD